MKARIRKTGEIVDIISYSGNTVRNDVSDYVSYIDSNGNECSQAPLNYYWDFEVIQESDKISTEINWEQRRYEIAKEIYPTIFGWYNDGTCSSEESVIRCTLRFTDKLIEELKSK